MLSVRRTMGREWEGYQWNQGGQMLMAIERAWWVTGMFCTVLFTVCIFESFHNEKFKEKWSQGRRKEEREKVKKEQQLRYLRLCDNLKGGAGIQSFVWIQSVREHERMPAHNHCAVDTIRVLNRVWSPLHDMLLFSRPVASDSFRPHGLQHVRLLCPSLSPEVYPSSCTLHRWFQDATIL